MSFLILGKAIWNGGSIYNQEIFLRSQLLTNLFVARLLPSSDNWISKPFGESEIRFEDLLLATRSSPLAGNMELKMCPFHKNQCICHNIFSKIWICLFHLDPILLDYLDWKNLTNVLKILFAIFCFWWNPIFRMTNLCEDKWPWNLELTFQWKRLILRNLEIRLEHEFRLIITT